MTQPQIMYRWGVKTRWGTGWRWGYGVSDPYVPKGTPLTTTRFTIDTYNDAVVAYTVPGSRIYAITNAGMVTMAFDPAGSIPSESFYLQSPNGQWWVITADGTTGIQTVTQTGGEGQPIGQMLPSPDGRLWYYLVLNDGSLFVQVPAQWFAQGDAVLYDMDNTGLLNTRYNVDGSVPDEVFSLQAPAGPWYQVRVDGTTGNILVTPQSGPGSVIGKTLPSPDGRLWTFSIDNSGTLHLGYQVQAYTVEPSA